MTLIFSNDNRLLFSLESSDQLLELGYGNRFNTSLNHKKTQKQSNTLYKGGKKKFSVVTPKALNSFKAILELFIKKQDTASLALQSFSAIEIVSLYGLFQNQDILTQNFLKNYFVCVQRSFPSFQRRVEEQDESLPEDLDLKENLRKKTDFLQDKDREKRIKGFYTSLKSSCHKPFYRYALDTGGWSCFALSCKARPAFTKDGFVRATMQSLARACPKGASTLKVQKVQPFYLPNNSLSLKMTASKEAMSGATPKFVNGISTIFVNNYFAFFKKVWCAEKVSTIKQFLPKTKIWSFAFSSSFLLFSMITILQRQEQNRWLLTFSRNQMPGLSLISQESSLECFENITLKYLNRKNLAYKYPNNKGFVKQIDCYNDIWCFSFSEYWNQQFAHNYTAVFSKSSEKAKLFDKPCTCLHRRCMPLCPVGALTNQRFVRRAVHACVPNKSLICCPSTGSPSGQGARAKGGNKGGTKGEQRGKKLYQMHARIPPKKIGSLLDLPGGGKTALSDKIHSDKIHCLQRGANVFSKPCKVSVYKDRVNTENDSIPSKMAASSKAHKESTCRGTKSVKGARREDRKFVRAHDRIKPLFYNSSNFSIETRAFQSNSQDTDSVNDYSLSLKKKRQALEKLLDTNRFLFLQEKNFFKNQETKLGDKTECLQRKADFGSKSETELSYPGSNKPSIVHLSQNKDLLLPLMNEPCSSLEQGLTYPLYVPQSCVPNKSLICCPSTGSPSGQGARAKRGNKGGTEVTASNRANTKSLHSKEERKYRLYQSYRHTLKVEKGQRGYKPLSLNPKKSFSGVCFFPHVQSLTTPEVTLEAKSGYKSKALSSKEIGTAQKSTKPALNFYTNSKPSLSKSTEKLSSYFLAKRNSISNRSMSGYRAPETKELQLKKEREKAFSLYKSVKRAFLDFPGSCLQRLGDFSFRGDFANKSFWPNGFVSAGVALQKEKPVFLPTVWIKMPPALPFTESKLKKRDFDEHLPCLRAVPVRAPKGQRRCSGKKGELQCTNKPPLGLHQRCTKICKCVSQRGNKGATNQRFVRRAPTVQGKACTKGANQSSICKRQKGGKGDLVYKPTIQALKKIPYRQLALNEEKEIKPLFEKVTNSFRISPYHFAFKKPLFADYNDYLGWAKDTPAAISVVPSVEEEKAIRNSWVAEQTLSNGLKGEALRTPKGETPPSGLFHSTDGTKASAVNAGVTEQDEASLEARPDLQSREGLQEQGRAEKSRSKNERSKSSPLLDSDGPEQEESVSTVEGEEKKREVTKFEWLEQIREAEQLVEKRKDFQKFAYPNREAVFSKRLQPSNGMIQNLLVSDRKDSFFGIANLFPKRLIAQDQKQINLQILQNEHDRRSISLLEQLSLRKDDSDLISAFTKRGSVLPKSVKSKKEMLSSLRTVPRNREKNNTVLGSELAEGKQLYPYSGLYTDRSLYESTTLRAKQHPIYAPNCRLRLRAPQLSLGSQSSNPQSRIDDLNLSQSHRWWQKRRTTSSLLGAPSKRYLVMPEITRGDWRKLIEWQLKTYLLEEEKRLSPLVLQKADSAYPVLARASKMQLKSIPEDNSFDVNTQNKTGTDIRSVRGESTKQELEKLETHQLSSAESVQPKHLFKIKKIALYLPWTTLKKSLKKPFEWPLTGLSYSSFAEERHLSSTPKITPEAPRTDFSFIPQDFATPGYKVSRVQNSSLSEDLYSSHREEEVLGVHVRAPLPTQIFVRARACPQRGKKVLGQQRCNPEGGLQGEGTYKRLEQNLIKNKKTDSCFVSSISPSFKGAVFSAPFTFSDGHSEISANKLYETSVYKPFLFEGRTKNSYLVLHQLVLLFSIKSLLESIYKIFGKVITHKIKNSSLATLLLPIFVNATSRREEIPLFSHLKKRLKDLVGSEHTVSSLSEIVWYLRNACRGRMIPRGVVLVETVSSESTDYLKAIGGEAQVPVIVQSLRALPFTQNHPQRRLEKILTFAQKRAPCILFLDDLDSIGQSRTLLLKNNSGVTTPSKNGETSEKRKWKKGKNDLANLCSVGKTELNISGFSSQNHRQTQSCNRFAKPNRNKGFAPPKRNPLPFQKETNQNDVVHFSDTEKIVEQRRVDLMLRLLTVMDGITHFNGVLIVTTSKNPASLDPALLRPGRFEKLINLKLPNKKKRIELLKLETAKIGHTNPMPWEYFGTQTQNMTGTEISSAVNHSAFRAIIQSTVHTFPTLEYGISCVNNDASLAQNAELQLNQMRGGVTNQSKASSAVSPPKGAWKGKTSLEVKKDGFVREKVAYANTRGKARKRAGLFLKKITVHNPYKMFLPCVQSFLTPDVSCRAVTNLPQVARAPSCPFGGTHGHARRFVSALRAVPLLGKKGGAQSARRCTNNPPLGLGQEKLFTTFDEKKTRFKKSRGLSSQISFYQAGKGMVRCSSFHCFSYKAHKRRRAQSARQGFGDNETDQHNGTRRAFALNTVRLYAGQASESLYLDSMSCFKNKTFKNPFMPPLFLQSTFSCKEKLYASSAIQNIVSKFRFYPKNFCIGYNSYTHLRKQLHIYTKTEQNGLVLFSNKTGKDFWWIQKISETLKTFKRPAGNWYRLYLPKIEQNKNNREWLLPDAFSNQHMSLLNRQNGIMPNLIPFHHFVGKGSLKAPKTSSKLLFSMHRKCNLSLHRKLYASGNDVTNKTVVQTPFLTLHEMPSPPPEQAPALPKPNTILEAPVAVPPRQGLVRQTESYSDFSYYSMVLNCFYVAFQNCSENRELLDLLADHLIRFKIVRLHEVLRIGAFYF